MPQLLLDWITFSYDDATRRRLLILYKQKESLLDSEVLQEHLLSQPLLGVLLFAFAVLSLGSFIFAIIFIACRALGNCGAKRYQPHPPNGHRYVIYLAIVVISWIGLAGSTIHFVGAGAALWNSPTDTEELESKNPALQPQKHRISRRDNSEKTVRQLFEDSDYVGDFEELDPTTSPPFVTEKPTTVARPSTTSAPKEFRKQGDSKNVKWFRSIGQSSRTTAAVNTSGAPISQFFLLESKLNIDKNSLTTAKPVSMHKGYLPRRRQNSTYPNRGEGSAKAISQPFVSDTWSNAGKQAFYRHELAPVMNGVPHSPPTTLVMDNSVTRTDSPVLIVPELREVVELENIQRNIVASEPGNGGKEASSPPSTTSTEAPLIVTATEPETTTTVATTPESTEVNSTSEEVTTTRAVESTESAETYSTTDSSESKSETTSTTVSAEVTEDLETSTDASTSSETTEAGMSDEASTGMDSLASSTNPPSDSSFELSLEWKEDPFTLATATTTEEEAATTQATTTRETTSTAATTTTTTTTTMTTVSATATPTTTSETTTATTTTATPPLIITGPIPAEDEQEEQTESTSTTSATPLSTVNRRRPMVHHRFGKNWRNMDSEEDSSPAVFHTTKVDATASIRPDTSTGENLKIQRKARYKVDSTIPTEQFSEGTADRNASIVVKMMREGQLSWPGRFFVLFIAIIMVLLTIPTPMLITAGTVCYMRSYHPMDRTTFSDKVGQICVVLATVLLFFIPCICLYLDALLAYIHIYFALCPEIQAMQQITVQSLNEPPPVDRIIRSISGAQLCQRNPEMHSIRDIWLACFAFVLFSLPTVFALFKLSKYYLRMKTEYYWNAGDGYGVIRPKVATTNDAIYGNIYGTLQVQRKRPASKPPPRPEPAAYGVYIEQPVYGAFK